MVRLSSGFRTFNVSKSEKSFQAGGVAIDFNAIKINIFVGVEQKYIASSSKVERQK